MPGQFVSRDNIILGFACGGGRFLENVKHDPRNDVATKHNMMHACPSSLEEMSAELHLWEETLALILHFEKNRRVNY